MKKSDRQKVFDKYGGKCAYCGCSLEKGWNVDHIEAFWHNVKTKEEEAKYRIKKGAHSIENFNPSCPRCNRWKSTFTIEQFRNEISRQIERLNKYSNNYRMAKDFGLLKETQVPVRFYFETIPETTSHNQQ